MPVKLLRYFPNQFFAVLAIAGLMAGLVLSKVVLSVAAITLLCNALLNIEVKRNISIWLRNKTNIFLLLVLILYLISGIYSDDKQYWLQHCRTKLPYLALPLGFAALKPLGKKIFLRLLFFYFILILISSLVVFINYILHFTTFNQNIAKGQPIPAPLHDHIRFSVEIAFAIFVGFYLWKEKFEWFFNLRIFILCGSILMIVILHFLAVRSGLLAFYVTALFWFIKWITGNKKFIKGAVLLFILICIAWGGFLIIPSLQSKIHYFEYEWSLIKNGDMKTGHNDAQRILSIQYGLQLGKQNFLTGVGIGDLKTEMQKAYYTNPDYTQVVAKMPHNQFIYVFAGTGIIGLVIFSLSFFYPVFANRHYKNHLFLSFILIIFLSMLTEHTLEIQIGVAFYLVFLLLFLHMQDREKNGKLNSYDA